MQMWIIATHNLNTFLGRYESDAKLSSTTDIRKAFQFSSKKEANNYINNQLPKSIRSNYKAVTEEEVLEAQTKSEEFRYIDLRSDTMLEAFRSVGKVIDYLPEYNKMLELKKQQVEDALVDIYHYIEFNNLGTVAAYKIYKQEQDLLRQRRQIKEELFCVDQLNEFLQSDKSKLSKYVGKLESTKDRTYLPKVLVELFEPQNPSDK